MARLHMKAKVSWSVIPVVAVPWKKKQQNDLTVSTTSAVR
jgi:hypothetical protein